MEKYLSKVSASTVAVLRIKRSSYLKNQLLLYFLELQGYEKKRRLITPRSFKKRLIPKKQNSSTKMNTHIHAHTIWEIFFNLNSCLFYYNATSLIFIHLTINHCCESILFQISKVLVILIALFPKSGLSNRLK